MNCPQCDGHGSVCDGCDRSLNSSRSCVLCEGEYCAPLHGSGRDCFTFHECKVREEALAAARSLVAFPMACPRCRGTVAVEIDFVDVTRAADVKQALSIEVLPPERHVCGYALREDTEFLGDSREVALEKIRAKLAMLKKAATEEGGHPF